MTRSFTEINKAIAWQVKESIGDDRFDMWFHGGDVFAIQDGRLVVSVIDELSLSFVRQQFETILRESSRAVLGATAELQFVVTGSQPVTESQGTLFTNDQLESAGQRDDKKQNPRQNRRRRNRVAANPDCHPAQVTPTESGFRAAFKSLDAFHFGKQNLLLETAIREVLAEPGKFNPLFLHGPTGCGKSHLAQAIVGQARNTRLFRRCVNITSEQFTSSFIDALQNRQLTSFRSKFRNVDLLAVDDIQFLAGKQATIVEFQNTMECLLRTGKQIVITADRPAHELNFPGDQLITRLSTGLSCPVAYPDVAGRTTIIRNLAATRNLQLDAAIVRLIAEQIARDVRLLSGAVNRLNAATMAWGKPVTIDSINEILGDLFQSQAPLLSLTRIENVVCDLCGVDASELRSTKRVKRISTARMLAMWLSRKYTSAGLAEIGNHYGGRSHSTVVAAEKRINGLLDSDARIDFAHRQTNISLAIGRLKNSLEVG